MVKLLAVPLCFVVGLVLLLSAVVLLVVDFSRHEEEYSTVPDATRMFLIIVSVHHRVNILLIASLWALLGVGLWVVALAIALDIPLAVRLS